MATDLSKMNSSMADAQHLIDIVNSHWTTRIETRVQAYKELEEKFPEVFKQKKASGELDAPDPSLFDDALTYGGTLLDHYVAQKFLPSAQTVEKLKSVVQAEGAGSKVVAGSEAAVSYAKDVQERFNSVTQVTQYALGGVKEGAAAIIGMHDRVDAETHDETWGMDDVVTGIEMLGHVSVGIPLAAITGVTTAVDAVAILPAVTGEAVRASVTYGIDRVQGKPNADFSQNYWDGLSHDFGYAGAKQLAMFAGNIINWREKTRYFGCQLTSGQLSESEAQTQSLDLGMDFLTDVAGYDPNNPNAKDRYLNLFEGVTAAVALPMFSGRGGVKGAALPVEVLVRAPDATLADLVALDEVIPENSTRVPVPLEILTNTNQILMAIWDEFARVTENGKFNLTAFDTKLILRQLRDLESALTPEQKINLAPQLRELGQAVLQAQESASLQGFRSLTDRISGYCDHFVVDESSVKTIQDMRLTAEELTRDLEKSDGVCGQANHNELLSKAAHALKVLDETSSQIRDPILQAEMQALSIALQDMSAALVRHGVVEGWLGQPYALPESGVSFDPVPQPKVWPEFEIDSSIPVSYRKTPPVEVQPVVDELCTETQDAPMPPYTRPLWPTAAAALFLGAVMFYPNDTSFAAGTEPKVEILPVATQLENKPLVEKMVSEEIKQVVTPQTVVPQKENLNPVLNKTHRKLKAATAVKKQPKPNHNDPVAQPVPNILAEKNSESKPVVLPKTIIPEPFRLEPLNYKIDPPLQNQPEVKIQTQAKELVQIDQAKVAFAGLFKKQKFYVVGKQILAKDKNGEKISVETYPSVIWMDGVKYRVSEDGRLVSHW